MNDGMMSVLQGLLLLLCAVLIAAWAAFFAMKSAGLYTLSKRRGLSKPYLAWFPVVRLWTVGSLADQYLYLVRGKRGNLRLFLPLLSVTNLFFCALLGSLIPLWIGEQTTLGEMFGSIGLFLGFPLVFWVLGWTARYRLFRSCVGKGAPMYFTLSVLIPGAESALLLWCCRRDDGMPPRKEPEET